MGLLDITKLPTAENSAIHLHPADNVAIARVPFSAGAECASRGAKSVDARADSGGPQSGAPRDRGGREDAALRAGHWARANADRSGRPRPHPQCRLRGADLRLRIPAGRDRSFPAAPADAPTFLGYAREDGRAGTRNYIAVVAASNCAAHTAELIAASFDGRDAAAECRRRGRVSARRRLRPHHRAGYDAAAANPGGRARSSQRFCGDHSGPRLRGEPDRSLPGHGRAANGPAGRHDAAVERRNARHRRGRAARDRAD